MMKPVKNKEIILFAVLLAAIGLIIYSNSFNNGFHFDDNLSIANNPNIQEITKLRKIWGFWPTRFLTYLSFALNFHFFGLKLFSYHLINILLHIANSLLVFWFARALTLRKEVSLLAALLFLVHPVATQPVNYIVQRAVLLATFFYILAICLYIKSSAENRESGFYFSRSIICAIFASFSKEIAVSLPLTIISYEYLVNQSLRNKWRKIIPFIMVSMVIPLTMLFTRTIDLKGMHRILEKAPETPIGPYLITQLRVMVTYLRLSFFPVNLNFDYDYHVFNSIFNIQIILSIALIAGIIILAFKLKDRILAFLTAWFFITLLPESSIIPIRDIIFEHRLYLALAGFSIAAIYLLRRIFNRLNTRYFVLLVTAVILIFSVASIKRNLVWRDELTLWTDVIGKSPNKTRAYVNRGLAYSTGKNYNSALMDYNRALSIENDASIYINRGVVYLNQKKYTLAEEDFNQAIALLPSDYISYMNRAFVYMEKNEFALAEADFNKALVLSPDNVDIFFNRGLAYLHSGKFNLAAAELSKAIELYKGDKRAEAYYLRGQALFYEKKYNEAAEDFEKSYDYYKNDAALLKLPMFAYLKNNEYVVAKYLTLKLTRLNPQNADYLKILGVLYAKLGEHDQAIAALNQSIRINPDLAESWYNLGLVYRDKHEALKAKQSFHKASVLGYSVKQADILQ